jgi:hypothetical protein
VLPFDSNRARGVTAAAVDELGLTDVTTLRVGMCVALAATHPDLGRCCVRIHQAGVDGRRGSAGAAAAREVGVRAPAVLEGPWTVDRAHQVWAWQLLDAAADGTCDADEIAAQVAALHTSEVTLASTRDAVAHRLDVILGRLETYRWRGTIDASLSDRIDTAARIAAAYAETRPAVSTAACHGDLKPSNAFAGVDGTWLLDWDSAVNTDPTWDVACWWLAERTTAADAETGEAAAEAFLASYAAAGGVDIDRERLAALAELKSLSVLTFLLGRDDDASRAEARLRLQHWSDHRPAVGWTDL